MHIVRNCDEMADKSAMPGRTPMAQTATTTLDRPADARGRLRAFRESLSRADRRSLVGMAAFIVLLHVVGFGILFGLVAPAALPPRRRPPRLHGRRRRPRLHLRPAARLRRRPHRRGRQHHPQADGRQRRARRRVGGRRAASRCRSASGSPSATRRSCSALAFLLSLGVKALAGQVEDDSSAPALGHRRDRRLGVRRVPVDPRHPQPGRAARHHQGLPRDAQRPVRRGRSSRSS